MWGLVDCNNFYASCETVFNPQLHNKALVILSNNDGCIISRSQQAKELGIAMGAPIFQYRDLISSHKLLALSSNFALYGDMSNRVMETLCTFPYEIDIYSIDEAFVTLDNTTSHFMEIGREIAKKIHQWTGISVSVGIASTKTLCKLATNIAKKKGIPAYLLNDETAIDHYLATIPSKEIWGIGHQQQKRLKQLHIFSAKELKYADPQKIQKHLSINAMRTVLELRGISCCTQEGFSSPKQSILCSRSFTSKIQDIQALEKYIASFTAHAAKKLRKANLYCKYINVFIRTSPYDKEKYSNSYSVPLIAPSNYTPELITAAKNGLKKIYLPRFSYKKAGIMLSELSSTSFFQPDLFSQKAFEKKKALMRVFDQLNKHHKLFFGSENKKWKGNQRLQSPNYTTDWKALPIAKAL